MPRACALRLAVPAVGLALVAWPHYVLNAARYLAYAKATAGGYAYDPVAATGLDFAVYAIGDLTWEVFGLGGTALLLAGLVAGLLCWRHLPGEQRAMVLLAVLAAAPPFLGFFLSRNQTERYLAISLVILAYPVGLLLGAALRTARAGTARALAGGGAGMALVQLALCWAVALGGPVEARPLRPLVEAAWRPNLACDFAPLVGLVPAGSHAPRLGLFGQTLAVNPPTIAHAFLRSGIPARAIEILSNAETEVDWPRVLREAGQVDLILVPEVFWQGGRDRLKPATMPSVGDHALGEFRARLRETGEVEDLGTIGNGPDELCAVHALGVRPPAVTPEDAQRLKPLRPEVHVAIGGT